jgi:hypothetical protein
MKVSPFQFEASPPRNERPAGERRDADVRVEVRPAGRSDEGVRAAGRSDGEDEPVEEPPDEPGYGHGV